MVDIKKLLIKCLAEFLATATYISLGCSACIAAGGLMESLAFGMAINVAMGCFYTISGAYVNPLVALTAAFMGRDEWIDGAIMIACEFFGTFVGYGFAYAFHGNNAVCGFILPNVDGYAGRALFCEFWLTFCWVISMCCFWEEERKESGPILIGLVVAGLTMSGVKITGAHMNPFRTLMIAVFQNHFSYCWAAIVGSIIGAVAAAALWKFVFSKKPPPKADAE